MECAAILHQLKQLANPARLEGMKRFGINVTNAIGVSVPGLRRVAAQNKKQHQLADQLWQTGIHEARILASMVDDPARVTLQQFDSWTNDFNSWDLCDQVCGNLFSRTPFAIEKAFEYSRHEAEYVKRAGFVLMAELAVHDKKADNAVFLSFLPMIEQEAYDDRNFVKKAANWALRQIGKRNKLLQSAAIDTAKRIAQQKTKAAKWIAAGALNELGKRELNK